MNLLEEAIECIRYDISKEEYTIRYGKSTDLSRRAARLIETRTNFDPYEHRLSKRSMVNWFRELILQLAEETHGHDDPDLEGIFEEMKAELLREKLGDNLATFELVFPLNLRPRESIPDAFTTLETTIERIPEDEWRDSYEQPATEADEISLTSFLDESPNDVYESDGLGGLFTYWRMDCDARDSKYASYLGGDIVRIWLAKLNYSTKKKNIFVSQPASAESPPNERMSQLREPFIYLIFQDDDYVEYRPIDYGLRRHSEPGRSQIDERMDIFHDLPNLPADRTQLYGVDETLVNALIAYQDGITESSLRQSFFAFWRGIERLAQVQRDEPMDRARDRAKFALAKITKLEPVRSEFDTAIEAIQDTRHDLIHKGPHINISEYDRSAAKLLLEALLELYFSLYPEDYTDDDYRMLLKYGTMSTDERDAKRKELNRSIEMLDKAEELQTN